MIDLSIAQLISLSQDELLNSEPTCEFAPKFPEFEKIDKVFYSDTVQAALTKVVLKSGEARVLTEQEAAEVPGSVWI